MTLAEVCVKRPVFAVMLIGFLVVLGVFAFRDLGVDLFPKADPATVSINVQLRGATPEEITTQVILPLEEAVSTISGITSCNLRLRTASLESRSNSFWSARSKAPLRMCEKRWLRRFGICRLKYCPR